jgi:hypothetical protein
MSAVAQEQSPWASNQGGEVAKLSRVALAAARGGQALAQEIANAARRGVWTSGSQGKPLLQELVDVVLGDDVEAGDVDWIDLLALLKL